MPIRVYAGTSVYGGVFDPGIDAPSGEFFAQVKTGRFQLVVSPVVVDELQDAPERVRQVYEEHLPWAEFIDVSVEAVRLRDGYLQGRRRHAEMGHRRPPRRPRQRGTLPLHCQLELQAHRSTSTKSRCNNGVNLINDFDSIRINTPAEVIAYET